MDSVALRPKTPKALANFSPGLERSDNPGIDRKKGPPNPERVYCGANPFRLGNKIEC